MAYCANCGQQLRDSAKFCDACGSPVEKDNSATYKKREQEYSGRIIKCPACGEELSAFTAVCPSCGHEMNSVKISPTLAAFSEKVETYDKEIATNIEKRTGWKTWSKVSRIVWIIANILTFGLLAVLVYGFKYIIAYSNHPRLSAVEKKKRALIENLSVPNEREATLEVLLFIKAKTSFLSTGKNDSRTAYWQRIWGTKAEQIYEKAKILLGEDTIAGQAIGYIRQCRDHSRKNVRLKTVLAVTCMIVYSVVVVAIHPATQLLAEQAGIDTPAASEYAGSVIETHKIKNYCGKNLAACGTFSSFYKEYQDNYGNGYVKLSIITEDGIYISTDDIDTMEQYIVVQQSIQSETSISFQFAKEKGGDYGRTTQMYRSFDEIVLFVKPLTANTSKFDGEISFVPVTESPDKNTYFVRDYSGRNLAACGTYSSFYGDFRDDYGAGQITLNIISDDGTYLHLDRIEQLREYVIVKQGTLPNTEVKFTFDEYVPSLRSFTGSSLASIDVYVTRLDEQTILDAYQTVYDSETYIEQDKENTDNNTATPVPPTNTTQKYKNYIWPLSGLSQYLPEPEMLEAEIRTDDETRFSIDFYNVTQQQFETYVNACKEKGFTISVTKTDGVFYAYNQEEYDLNIIYMDFTDDKTMSVFLDAPLKMSEIRWPNTDLVRLLPIPNSLVGNISQESSDYFGVYIDNVSADDFAEYIDQCMDNGFVRDYSRSDRRFEGYNRKGFRVCLELHEFDVMYIAIEAP